MKFIKNSIDSEYLQESISDADLEKQMANCEVKSEVFNGHRSEGIKPTESPKMERIKVTKLTNGIHEKSGSPTKCNGKVNGFYEEEEDFNLVLEDSSEGGESPSKKIDDDSISAPQIVQQIEDLLGITSSSVGIEEELNTLDGTESMDDNLEDNNGEDIEDNQDIQVVFEGITENKVEECQEMFDRKAEATEENKNQLNNNIETIESDTPSHMNLVFDEVEVGMETGDLGTLNKCNLPVKSDNTECKVASTTEANNGELKDQVTSKIKDIDDIKDDALIKNPESADVSLENKSCDVPSTQSSTLSCNSEEWVVLDSVESSDEEKLQWTLKSSNTVDNDVCLSQSAKSGDETSSETDCSMQNNNLSCENLPPVESKTSSDSEVGLSVHASKTQLKQSEAIDTPERTPSLLVCEGDGVRKRSASIDDETIEFKKPKLDDDNCFEETSSPILKRPSSVITENENKRTKLSETTEECTTPDDSKVNEKPEIVKDVSENELKVTENEYIKDNQITENTLIEEEPISEKTHGEKPVFDREETHTLANTDSKTFKGNDIVQSLTVPEKTSESLLPEVETSGINVDTEAQCTVEDDNPDFTSSKEFISPSDNQKNATIENNHSLAGSITDQIKQSNETQGDNEKLNCQELESISNDKSQHSEEKSVSNEKKENLSSSIVDSSKHEVGFKLDDLSSVKSKEPCSSDQPKLFDSQTKSENKGAGVQKQISVTKELSTSIKELEKSLISGHEKIQASRELKGTAVSKKMTNLDFAIERVVEKARIQTEKKVPILKKFHKDQLKKLKRSELEEIVVSKICEAVTYKSEIGQMRLRTQNLEETNEMWRKKVQQIEKQNRELEMVLKRFLAELAHIKRENQNKVPMPIKVTRSVGLQVVLASSMHGALVSSRSKMNNEATLQQQQLAKARQSEREKEKIKESVKASTFNPPSQSSIGKRGRPPKGIATQNSRPLTPQTLPPKVTPPTTPSKPANSTPIKTISTPNKDLEVIDLTDKEEKAKSTSQPPVSGSIRVAPSTQVCFVQQNAAPSPPQQPLYLVQKAGQRPQFLVATSSPSPSFGLSVNRSPDLQQRPISNVSRPPPSLTLPVFRTSGHLIPVQTSPQVGVKPSTNTSPTATAVARQVSTPLRIQQPNNNTNKHPAPLPSEPPAVSKPGMKAPPPKPQLKIAKTSNGIMLSWSMALTKEMADMQSYQLYAYQEGNQPPSTGLWKKVGDVKALPLPMACTLTQFIEGHRYHFAVRAKDIHGRIGPFSTPSSILLTK